MDVDIYEFENDKIAEITKFNIKNSGLLKLECYDTSDDTLEYRKKYKNFYILDYLPDKDRVKIKKQTEYSGIVLTYKTPYCVIYNKEKRTKEYCRIERRTFIDKNTKEIRTVRLIEPKDYGCEIDLELFKY